MHTFAPVGAIRQVRRTNLEPLLGLLRRFARLCVMCSFLCHYYRLCCFVIFLLASVLWRGRRERNSCVLAITIDKGPQIPFFTATQRARSAAAGTMRARLVRHDG
jgi:hypothetical protein